MRLFLVLAAVMTTAAADPPPSWPARGDDLALVWVIHPEVVQVGSVGTRKARVELVARIGAVERTVALGETYGALSPLDQPMCASAARGAGAPPPVAFDKGEVGKLVFGGGIVRGYAVTRPRPDQLAIGAFDRGDESCGKPVCPARPVATIAIPTRVKRLAEQIVLVDKAGKRTPLDCKVD